MDLKRATQTWIAFEIWNHFHTDDECYHVIEFEMNEKCNKLICLRLFWERKVSTHFIGYGAERKWRASICLLPIRLDGQRETRFAKQALCVLAAEAAAPAASTSTQTETFLFVFFSHNIAYLAYEHASPRVRARACVWRDLVAYVWHNVLEHNKYGRVENNNREKRRKSVGQNAIETSEAAEKEQQASGECFGAMKRKNKILNKSIVRIWSEHKLIAIKWVAHCAFRCRHVLFLFVFCLRLLYLLGFFVHSFRWRQADTHRMRRNTRERAQNEIWLISNIEIDFYCRHSFSASTTERKRNQLTWRLVCVLPEA